jgi:hypothetical protein
VASISTVRTIAIVAILMIGRVGEARSDDLDALFLGGYWCNTETKTKSENIPRNRSFLLSREIEGPNASDANYTERLIDIVADVRGQRIVLAQSLKLPDGKSCKTNCTIAERIVHKDMLEVGDWNSSTGVFKANSPKEFLYRCDK